MKYNTIVYIVELLSTTFRIITDHLTDHAAGSANYSERKFFVCRYELGTYEIFIGFAFKMFAIEKMYFFFFF